MKNHASLRHRRLFLFYSALDCGGSPPLSSSRHTSIITKAIYLSPRNRRFPPTPLESALTQNVPVTPLESALTIYIGGGYPSAIHSPYPQVSPNLGPAALQKKSPEALAPGPINSTP